MVDKVPGHKHISGESLPKIHDVSRALLGTAEQVNLVVGDDLKENIPNWQAAIQTSKKSLAGRVDRNPPKKGTNSADHAWDKTNNKSVKAQAPNLKRNAPFSLGEESPAKRQKKN